MADIFFATTDRSSVYQLPVLPAQFPELSRSASNEEFETFDNGTYNLIGNVGLVSFTLDGFLPAMTKRYTFARSKINPYTLINLWARAMADKKPLRVIMNRNRGLGLPEEAVNMMVTVESMSHYEDRVGDVVYSLSLKEYRELV
ncbi:MAG: hypothetical protein AB7E31_04205 [Desulfitobacterium sp.]